MQRWKLSWALNRGDRIWAREQRHGGGRSRVKEVHRAKSNQSSVAQEEIQERGPGLPRAESDLNVAVSGEALGFRGQQGFKMTSQSTGVFQRGRVGWLHFSRAGTGVILTKKHPNPHSQSPL